MRMSKYALLLAMVFVAVFVFLTSSCGRSGDLASVDGVAITTEEYLSAFNALPADIQVSVLEPGGRLLLMNRIVMKKALLTAWAEDPSVSDGWEDLYKISILSDSMFSRIGYSFNYEEYIDSLSTCGLSNFSLRVVLLDDSALAVETAMMWDDGIFEDSYPSMSAPWSLQDGSSYRIMTGPVQRITSSFQPLINMESGVTHVLPMFGEWCVCLLHFTEGEWVPEDGIGGVGLMNLVAAATPHNVLSRGITALAENCLVSGTSIVPVGEGTSEPVVDFGGYVLTVADIMNIMRKADSSNFQGDIPAELSIFAIPVMTSNTEVALWFYVKSIAQRYALSKLAIDHGVILPDNALDYARAESVVRARVLEASVPDSAGVAAWYIDNSDIFMIPERRSILLGYTDSSYVAGSQPAATFEDIPSCQTLLDQEGNMLPTPPQIEQAFGVALGSAVFAAELEVFSGPITLDGELAAWFEVIEIVPPEIASLEDVYLQAELLAASSMFDSGFDSLMEDLLTRYSVTIDTAAVIEIDLWGGTQ